MEEKDYKALLLQAVTVIDTARTNLARQITATTTQTYWGIGKLLYERKLESKHGSNVVRRLSEDLKLRYPTMGLSPRNLWYMKSFFERYRLCDSKVQRAVALLPWSHNVLIISHKLNDQQVLYYAQETLKKGWNRDLLLNAIKMNLHEAIAPRSYDNNRLRKRQKISKLYKFDDGFYTYCTEFV